MHRHYPHLPTGIIGVSQEGQAGKTGEDKTDYVTTSRINKARKGEE
ncbi:MAG: hypothetical protein AAFO75_13635 [Pseudomonadota bacterium]